ncbi:MBL fold metallo-hydrolase [Streptococcus dentiloxodontae]
MSNFIYKIISKKKQISPHIFEVEFDIGIFIISIWVVEKNGSYFLIDTGMGEMANYVVNHYLNSSRVKGLFLTHGHSDHVGGIPQLKEILPDLSMVIDRNELPYVTGKKPYPRREKVESLTFDVSEFTALDNPEAEKLFKEAGLTPVFSPGHSLGHTCYYHAEDNVLIAGDLLTTSRFGKLKPPMKSFTADMDQALQSAHEVLKKYPQALLSVCHGGEVEHFLTKLEASSWYQKR